MTVPRAAFVRVRVAVGRVDLAIAALDGYPVVRHRPDVDSGVEGLAVVEVQVIQLDDGQPVDEVGRALADAGVPYEHHGHGVWLD